MAAFIALLEHEPGLSYCVWFPDLPGCTSGGDTPEDAMKNAQTALSLHLESMMEDDAPIPEPSSLNDIARNPEWAGQIPFLVNAQIEKSKPIRLNISLDERLVEAIDSTANRLGKTRSAFLADAAREAISKAS